MRRGELTGPGLSCAGVVCVPDRYGMSARRQEARRAPTRKVLERFDTVRVTRRRRAVLRVVVMVVVWCDSLIHKSLRVYYSFTPRYTISFRRARGLVLALRCRRVHYIPIHPRPLCSPHPSSTPFSSRYKIEISSRDSARFSQGRENWRLIYRRLASLYKHRAP